MNDHKTSPDDPANRDPISGAPGAHPIGTGVGAALGGAAAGALVGTAVGPVGTFVGAALGAVVGGLAGKDFAETLDPTQEDTYWQDNYRSRPYVEHDSSFDDYGPAYRFGAEAFGRYSGLHFDAVESELAQRWTTAKGASRLRWDSARHAAREAWSRAGGAA